MSIYFFQGSVVASLVTSWVLPQEWVDVCALGANTLPAHVTGCQGVGVEAITTMLLVLTVLVVSDKHPNAQYKVCKVNLTVKPTSRSRRPTHSSKIATELQSVKYSLFLYWEKQQAGNGPSRRHI